MKIFFKGKDNSVAIMELAPGADKMDAIKKFQAAHAGFYEEYFEEDIEVPEDRTFRDAWKLQGSKIIVDGVKAMDIHLNRVRKLRNKKLEELDKEQLRYLSNPEKLKEVEDKKQMLRDLPQNITNLKEVECLQD